MDTAEVMGDLSWSAAPILTRMTKLPRLSSILGPSSLYVVTRAARLNRAQVTVPITNSVASTPR